MRVTQRKLLEFLQEKERCHQSFAPDDMAEVSGLSLTSVKAYISKKLKGVLLTAVDDSRYRAHDTLQVSPSEFEELMSQVSRVAVGTPVEWRAALQSLLKVGKERGYRVRPIAEDLLKVLGL